MIVYFNVCDHCGNQNEIKEGDSQFVLSFTTQSAHEFIKKGRPYPSKDFQGTFCDKECMINYFQEFLSHNGKLKNVEENKDES